MAAERELELLDDYIANKLTGGEKDAFEQKLKNDASLQNEFQLQQKLIDGIKKARLTELKSMLNNTAVPPVKGQTALLSKVASWLVVAGIIGAGVYFYFTKEDKQEIAEQPSVNNSIQNNDKVAQESTEQVVIENKETKTTNKNTDIAVKRNETTEFKNDVNSNSTASVPTETKAINRQKPDVFDPTSETESNSAPENNGVKVNSNNAKLVASTIEVKTDNANKKYTFHYQFKNGKLFLYGSFEKNLYEIMEFFNENKRTVFLFYKDSYYLLNEENEQIKPLASITDPVLQQKLKDYRGNN